MRTSGLRTFSLPFFILFPKQWLKPNTVLEPRRNPPSPAVVIAGKLACLTV